MTEQKTTTGFGGKRQDSPKESMGGKQDKYFRLVLPLFLLLAVTGTFFLPKTNEPGGGTTIKTLSAEGFPAALVFEQQDGIIRSVWLRSPAGTREIEGLKGLSYVSDNFFVTKTAQGGRDDLLWRTSFTNFAGKGVHLWVGLLPAAGKVHIATSPYNYTKWDNIPAKLIVPKGTAVYISPAIPDYGSGNGKETFLTKDCYSFVYTIRMTPEGPAFIPVPIVYRQLAELLRAGMQGEYSTSKRLAYTRMLDEFNKLADGNPPSAETLLNLQLNKIETLSWRNDPRSKKTALPALITTVKTF